MGDRHWPWPADPWVMAFSAADIRAAEAVVFRDVPDGALMDLAAARLARTCLGVLRRSGRRSVGRRVVLLVGSGNNGGDALLAGASLRRRGVAVDAFLTAGRAHPRGLAALATAGGRVHDVSSGVLSGVGKQLADADLLVDGIVGLGSSGAGVLRGAGALMVGRIPVGVPVVAVDLPSGVHPDTGEFGDVHVRADVTVTFGAWKPCLLLPHSSPLAGEVEFVDVGLGPHLSPDTARMRRITTASGALWPAPQDRDHKYTRGVLGVVAGSDTYPGAAVLACAGGVRAGAGVVRYVGPTGATAHVIAARPEVVPGMGRVQAWLLGSGVVDDPAQDAAVGAALDSGLPCVVDAGALEECVRRRMAGRREAGADRVLLTPHAGELATALTVAGHPTDRGAVEARPWEHASVLARLTDTTVLIKGSTTLIVSPDGSAFSQADGPAWLAAAGSGDVLAGAAGALLAAGVPAATAGALAAHVHGRAGARASGGGPAAALDVADALPSVIAGLLGSD